MSIPLKYVGNKEQNLAFFENKPELLKLYKKVLNDEIVISAWIDKDASPEDIESILQFIIDFHNGKANIEEVNLNELD